MRQGMGKRKEQGMPRMNKKNEKRDMVRVKGDVFCLFQVLFYVHLLLFAASAMAANPATGLNFPPAKGETNGSQRYITIDFDNVDIHLFIKYISELTGKNFVVDRAVQGNVTIISPTKISEEQAYKVFESVLEVHGFTTVEAGSVIKILPSARARSQNVKMLKDGSPADPQDRVVTQLVPLQFSSPEELKKILTPLVSQTSVLIAHAPSGMLIITETLSNIQKLLNIIEVLDVESREAEIAVIPLENASTKSLAKILTTVYQKTGATPKGAQRSAIHTTRIVPYERVNALVVLASASEMGRIKSLIEMLDTRIEKTEGNIHVYYLQNATAVELAKVLSTLPEKQASDPGKKPKEAAISKDVRIMADGETNSLIITASKDEYLVLEEVIRQLDIPRRMVYLEALIMEVDTEKTFDVGVQWAGAGTFADETGLVVSGFSGAEGFDLLGGLNPEDPVLPPGFSFGVLKQGIQIGSVVFPDIAAILRAYKTDSDINIISTPQILTMDNTKAEISVGENVPFITSQNTTASQQDYTQYEYKDVTTKLTITPHINQAESLRLEIQTEVIRLKGSEATLTPTTFTRTADTTVVLNDRDTVVIGGIIGQDAEESEWKIPLLGDIPGLGWLFKTHSSSTKKVNMFIFITPHIVRNPAEIAAVTLEKKDEMSVALPAVKEELSKKVNPRHADELVESGYNSLRKDELDTARQFFSEALKIDPANPYALMNMGVVYERQNDPGQALQMYRKVISGRSDEVAGQASDDLREGSPLVDLAWEGVQRISGSLRVEGEIK